MTERDTFFQGADRILDFEFDERVAQVFDDMVARSVPYYADVQRMQAELAVELLPEGESLVCDLGCSTGTTIGLLATHPRCPSGARFLGIDNAAAMLAKAREKLAGPIAEQRVDLCEGDLDGGIELPPCQVVFMNWTLQFVRPVHRALFLSEKVLVSDSLLNRVYIDLYLRYKKAQGYTDTEIQRKRESLENVLVPYRLEENLTLLEQCGFHTVDVYFRWLNFACLLAVKDT
jgi:tRNA (cmo5U34)-methyltransferase